MFRPLQNLDKYDVILASGSPRRRQLLKMLDIDFAVDTSHPVDETHPAGMPPHEIPAYLSKLKADAYPLAPDDRRLVITADTVVILDGEVLGKPGSLREAADMLALLQGRTQTVITAVTIRSARTAQTWSVGTEVDFAPLSPEEIAYYVENYHPTDKAGAYGIQEWIGAAAISSIRGSFYNVMGLPVHKLYQALKQL